MLVRASLRRAWFGLQMIPVPYSRSRNDKNPASVDCGRFTVRKGLLLMCSRCFCRFCVFSLVFVLLVPGASNMNWCCFRGFVGFLDVALCFLFLFDFFVSCMQSRFIPIEYCSNILIVPELCFGFWCLCELAVLLAALLPFCFLRVMLDLWMSVASPLWTVLFIRLWSTTAETKKGLLDANKSACLRFPVLRTQNTKRWCTGFGLLVFYLWECFYSFLDCFTGFSPPVRPRFLLQNQVLWSAFDAALSPPSGSSLVWRSRTRRSWFGFSVS